MFDNNNTENYKMKNLVDISAMVTQSLNFFDIKDKIIEKMLEVVHPTKACVNLFYRNNYEYAYLVCSETLNEIPDLFDIKTSRGIKIDSLALNIIKLIIVMITLILAFEINTLLGIGLFLIEFLYIIYKRNLEQQILDSIKHLKDNVEMTTLDVLTERGKSGINILITLLILGLITNFNWSKVISFIVVFLFTIKDIYSNIK